MTNRIDIYKSSSGRSTEGGVQFPYPSTPTFSQIPCSIQAETFEEVDEQERISQVLGYRIIFGSFLAVNPRDMMTFADPAGVIHTVFVEAVRDNAGRGAAFSVRAREKT